MVEWRCGAVQWRMLLSRNGHPFIQTVLLQSSQQHCAFPVVIFTFRAMPKFAHELGLAEAVSTTVPFGKWQRSISEAWFSSRTAFLAHVAFAGISFPAPFTDTPTIRAIAVFCHYGLVEKWTKCCVVGCPGIAMMTELTRSDNGRKRYCWTCSKTGHYHMREPVAGLGPLSNIRLSGWMAFLNFITLLRLNLPLHLAYNEVRAACGNIDKTTFRTWRRHFKKV